MSGIRNIHIHWGRTALRLDYDAELGYVVTEKGSHVPAARLLQNTLTVSLTNIDTGANVERSLNFFDQFQFDISYNCFGYCFANGEVWISDPSQIIKDDYEEVGPEDAEIILFKEYTGFNDNGEEVFIYSHAVKVLRNGNVSFKPGVNPLIENAPAGNAIHTYNFNHKVFLRKKAVD